MLLPIELLQLVNWHYKPYQQLRVHNHPYYQIIFIIHGQANAVINDMTTYVKPNDLLFVHPEENHGLELQAAQSLKTSDVKFRIHRSDIKEMAKRFPSFWPGPHPDIVDVLQKIKHELVQKKFLFESACDILLQNMMVLLSRKKIAPGHDRIFNDLLPSQKCTNSILKRALEIIKKNFTEHLSLQELANRSATDKAHLCRVFKEYLGSSPIHYLYRYRIYEARERLVSTSDQISKIAYDVGFKDGAHFSKVFRELTGVTPGQWRNRERVECTPIFNATNFKRNVTYPDGSFHG